jgi:hypothetical protein
LPRRPDSPAVFFFKAAGADRRFPSFAQDLQRLVPILSQPPPCSILILWHNNVATSPLRPRVLPMKVSIAPYKTAHMVTTNNDSLNVLARQRIQQLHPICSPEPRRNPVTNAFSPSSLAGFVIGSVIAVASCDLFYRSSKSSMTR